MSKHDFSDLDIPLAEPPKSDIPLAEPPVGKLPAQLQALLTRAEQGDPDAQYATGMELLNADSKQGTTLQGRKDSVVLSRTVSAPPVSTQPPTRQLPVMLTHIKASELYGSDALPFPFQRKNIHAIEFLDTLANAPPHAFDWSLARDRSVLGWTRSARGRTTLFLAGEGGVAAPPDSSLLFIAFRKLNELHFNGCFDTANVTDMRGMFAWCKALSALDLSSFNTKSVTDMSGMFSFCEKLTRLDLSAFNTENVTDMRGMFFECRALSELNLSSFNTENVTDMRDMFFECRALSELDLSSFNTENVTDMRGMFAWCKALSALDLSSFNTQNVADMIGMFDSCRALRNRDELLAMFNRH